MRCSMAMEYILSTPSKSIIPTEPVMHRRRFPARQSGQGTIEYIGIAVIAAIIIAGIVAAPLAPNMTSGLEKIICGVLKNSPFGGKGVCSPPEPPKCITATDSARNGSEAGIKVVNFKSGQGYKVTYYSDGSADLVETDDYTLEGAFGLKNAKLKGNGLNAAITASGGYANGSKRHFSRDEMKELDAAIAQAEDRANSGHQYVPGGQIFNGKSGEPDATSTEFNLSLGAEGKFSLEKLAQGRAGDNAKKEGTGAPGTDFEAGGGIEIGGKGQHEHDRGNNKEDPSDDTHKYTYGANIDGELLAGGKLKAKDVAELKASVGGNLGAESLVTYKTDAAGNITNITFTTATERGSQNKLETQIGKKPKDDFNNDKTKSNGPSGKGSDSTMNVTTTSIDIDTPEKREIAEQFRNRPFDPMVYLMSAFPEVGDYPVEDLSPMAELMKEDSYVRRATYDANSDTSREDYFVYAHEQQKKSTNLTSGEQYVRDPVTGEGQWQPDATCNM